MAVAEEHIVNGQRIRLQGLRKTLRALEATGVAAEDMKDLMHAIGTTVVTAANPLTPRDTGTLAGTLRAGRGKTKAVIRAGGARAPYAGVIHYGWPARSITASPYLTKAVTATSGRVLKQLDDGIAKLIKQHN